MGSRVKQLWESRGTRLAGRVPSLRDRAIGEYNPKGRHTGPELAHLADTIRRIEPKWVLDVGSGYGLIWLWLRQQNILSELDYTCCDFAETYRDIHERVTGLRPAKWDGATLPFDDNSFDLVISYAVLLHVPPEDVGRHLSELGRVSRRWLYVHTARVMRKWGVTDFKHDYASLFDSCGLCIVDEFISTDRRRVNWLLACRGE
jgi:SAM-dependent methyltransferase